LISHPAKEEGIGPVEVLDRVTMQLFVRENSTMIAAPVQCNVDGIPKGSHYAKAPIAIGRSNGIELSRLVSPRIHSSARVDAGLARSAPASLLGSLKIQTTE
jgi:hypothetical protein